MATLTKKALAESLKILMKKATLDKINVTDVVSHCGVNRQTFYYHFKDIYDLVEWIYKTEAVESINKYKSYNTWQQGFFMIFEYVGNNLEFCTNCFNSLGREHLDRFLYDITFGFLMGVVDEVAEDTDVKYREKRFIANFYTYAFIGIMTQWIREGANEDPANIINDINQLIEGDIKRKIHNYL
ncbi:TetR/AcrR family transcriptional regulator C-terminal domain-containing protein [Clostridium grantii]|uniref:Transcriptional regulator, TetR family n=1 Tax=Clostridium grantii DSM 8605 TaxID=1121316 RepID=A0A1M5S9U2_9CLOT|nr:TetR/AcrR family transcriptional regulator C-terminal domain-containing protein [Clostridium grantii]SHH35284.1 transcriptional regulator, TetR family [Clostridium grantii DSM 8605]